jgi:hypothetical protein
MSLYLYPSIDYRVVHVPIKVFHNRGFPNFGHRNAYKNVFPLDEKCSLPVRRLLRAEGLTYECNKRGGKGTRRRFLQSRTFDNDRNISTLAHCVKTTTDTTATTTYIGRGMKNACDESSVPLYFCRWHVYAHTHSYIQAHTHIRRGRRHYYGASVVSIRSPPPPPLPSSHPPLIPDSAAPSRVQWPTRYFYFYFFPRAH